ncbi:molybdenum ABC transporter ATP-binding protein [Thiobacillus sp.]|uniref:molybdenum ABC transporter ATP-binding protein n=1 Tax=Thiobacillus sp. TaxID=924 RepID=UPI001849D9B9|nr:molybdenum ABC transporter ATP-binding protein [Thiobacillus sp.]MBC2729755.1 molybdenum ABC transporter ATP-binding protein [Thiobacillus sp.]MBC2738490.1 molybdenum ABC transporter ATP-binding protein [Thiobacillus sp.]MBC2761230.1 molybdenum ABC transporter ATP-binding protein [Thiobacillus sp.]
MKTVARPAIHARFKLDYPGFSLDVDLTLPGQGVTALFGHSGSGKTTLLRAIAGLERVAGGRLAVNGETWQDDAVFRPTHQRPLGYVFQEASLFPHLSVQANLEYGQKRVPAAVRRVSLDQAVAMLDIGHLLGRKPARLSGGERQRVGIARALATSPRLLLMDEPLAALDHARKQEILPYLERLHDELDIPVLYVSHAPDEVARLADHIVVMEGGRALATGPLTDTLARLDLPIKLGEDAGVVLDAVVAERDAEWHLAHMEFAGGHLWVRDHGLPVGHAARVRILARDVSLARTPHSGTSILNTLPAVVVDSIDDTHPALTLVKLRVGESPLLARLTRRSAHALELAPGQLVYVQIKAVALIG